MERGFDVVDMYKKDTSAQASDENKQTSYKSELEID